MSSRISDIPMTRIFDLLPFVREQYGPRTVFGIRKNGVWTGITYEEYVSLADRCSSALLNAGICKGDRVVSITQNRPEFNILDMGLMQVGAVHVPLYQGLSDEKLFRILDETGCQFIFLNSLPLYNRIAAFRDRLQAISGIISFEKTVGIPGFDEFIAASELHPGLEEAKNAVQPDDPASIIYISGISTPVKGITLTHRNQVAVIRAYSLNTHFKGIENTISLLPLAHSYEKVINYCEQYFGLTIWYNDKIPGMVNDFREVKPDMVVMVPLLIERMFQSFCQKSIQSGRMAGPILSKALATARKTAPGSKVSLPGKLLLALAKKLIFSRWKEALGGKLEFILCGGAALNPEILNLAYHAGITIYEGYGITEAGPLVSYNAKEAYRSYTVGKVMKGVQIRIADDGEVLVKSEGVMPGYFQKPEETREVIDTDGWLHTGDLGRLDQDGYLTLTGVKKDLFKLSSGIYVDPVAIEKKLKGSEYIKNVWVYGHNRNHLVAFLVPDPEAFPADSSKTEIRAKLQEVIRRYNLNNKGPDQVSRFAISSFNWSEDPRFQTRGGINREALFQYLREEVEQLYREP